MDKINYSFYIFLTYIFYRIFISDQNLESKENKNNINKTNVKSINKSKVKSMSKNKNKGKNKDKIISVNMVNDNRIKKNEFNSNYKINNKFKIKKIVSKVDNDINFDKNLRKFVQVIKPQTNIQSKEKIIKNELQSNNIKALKEKKSDSKIITKQIKINKNIPENNNNINYDNDKIVKHVESNNNSESFTSDNNLIKNIIKPINYEIEDKIKNIKDIINKNKKIKEISVIVSKSSSPNEKKIIEKRKIGNDDRISYGYYHIKDNLSNKNLHDYPQKNNFDSNENIERMSDIILKQNKGDNIVNEFSNIDKLDNKTNINNKLLDEEERIHKVFKNFQNKKLNNYKDDLNPKYSLKYIPLLKCDLENINKNSRIMDAYDNFIVNPEKDIKLKRDMYSFVEQYKNCGY